MKESLIKILKYFCVPLALLCEGIIFRIIFQILTANGLEFSSAARFFLSVVLTLLGMFMLRRVPKRTLVISSIIACGIVLIVNVLQLAAVNNRILVQICEALTLFKIVPNNIVLLPASLAVTVFSPTASIIFTSIEVLLPMCYAASEIFVSSGLQNRKKKRNNK